MICPNCKLRQIGKIGVNQFFCWHCLIELSIHGDSIHLHQVEVDGSLSTLNDLFLEDELKVRI